MKPSKDSVLFNDMLGSSMGSIEDGSYKAIDRTSFGETSNADDSVDFFTGKPKVEGLGHAFLYRNYRADLGKWQTQDPIGYPDGWNNFAYCNNDTAASIDRLGLWPVEGVVQSIATEKATAYLTNALSTGAIAQIIAARCPASPNKDYIITVYDATGSATNIVVDYTITGLVSYSTTIPDVTVSLDETSKTIQHTDSSKTTIVDEYEYEGSINMSITGGSISGGLNFGTLYESIGLVSIDSVGADIFYRYKYTVQVVVYE